MTPRLGWLGTIGVAEVQAIKAPVEFKTVIPDAESLARGYRGCRRPIYPNSVELAGQAIGIGPG